MDKDLYELWEIAQRLRSDASALAAKIVDAQKARDAVLQHSSLESAILGAILIDNAQFGPVSELITADSFESRANAIIYDALYEMRGLAKPLDLVSLKDHLEESGLLDRVGGAAYLASLLAGVPRSARAVSYAELLAERVPV